MKKRILAIFLCITMMVPLMACNIGKDLPDETQVQMGAGDADVALADDGYDAETANEAAMDFAVRSLQECADYAAIEGTEESNNILISPISVYFALGMLENGAKNETKTELEEVLGLNVGQMNSFAKEYMNQVPEELKIANSIWYTSHERFTVEEPFIQSVKGYYNGEIFEAAFDDSTCKDINDWVEEKTDGTIKEVLNEIPPDAVMYLINALVFEAEWENTYDESQVREGIFTVLENVEQEVDMMYSEESYYLEDEKATGFIKYYDGREYAFVALLPNENVGIQEYIGSLTGAHLLDLLEHPVEVPVQACIPQFELQGQIEMKDILAEMGIQMIFDDQNADLSGLGTSTAGNLFVDRVIHKTYIEVSPAGTKAGAATVIEVRDECAFIYEEMKEVYLNRPFLYMIIDCENNQPIFIGTVNFIGGYRCGIIDDLCGYPLNE